MTTIWTKIRGSAGPAPNICIDFLNNECPHNRTSCSGVHAKYPFLWQVEISREWHNFSEFHNKEIELEFRVPSSDGVELSAVDPTSGTKFYDSNEKWYADFDKMAIEGDNSKLNIRRLSTVSSQVNNDHFSTRYEWFFKDERSRWILYGQSVGRNNKGKAVKSLSTTSSSDDIERQVAVNKLKAWSIHSAQNKYHLDFVKMTQTNMQTNVARPIRRRPVASTITLGAGPVADYTQSPMPAASAPKKYKWQFLDERNQWIDYGSISSGNDPSCVVATNSDQIEQQYAANPKSVCLIRSASHQYHIDFNTMKQRNLKTNVVRDVRRVLVSNGGPVKKFSALSLLGDEDGEEEEEEKFAGDDYEWFFCDENNQWVKYGEVSSGNDQNCVPSQGSDDIERNFRTKGSDVMTIKSRQHTYELNFRTMMQTNLKTRVQRPMCRRAKAPSDVALSMHVGYDWYFKEDDGSWVKYGKNNSGVGSGDIEKHFHQNPSTNLNLNVGGNSYVIDFAKMTQANTSTGKVREIRRRKALVSMNGSSKIDTSHTNITFSNVPNGKKVFAQPLASNDSEYTSCLQLVRATNPGINPRTIYKIHNPYLKVAFENKKAFLKSMYPNVPYTEKRLFHGTKPANVQAILEENIDWRLHGTSSGQSLGRGAYFSSSAQVSSGYGRVIFICRVLVGLVTTGNSHTIRPSKDAANQPYDTTVDQPANPSVFVKYDSQEYCPEYYLEY